MHVMEIHLTNNETIKIKDKFGFVESIYLQQINDGNNNIAISHFIIPKSSINYIEFKEDNILGVEDILGDDDSD